MERYQRNPYQDLLSRSRKRILTLRIAQVVSAPKKCETVYKWSSLSREVILSGITLPFSWEARAGNEHHGRNK